MMQDIRAWLRRKLERLADPKASPPPYDSLGPNPRVLTPLARRDPAIAAAYNANMTATAITARAIAEGRDAASAMDKALRRIQTAIPELVQSYGVQHDHRLVASIWADAIWASADTAREIAQSTKPSYAINLARRTEAYIKDGSADEIALNAFNMLEAFNGVPPRHKTATEAKTHREDLVAR